MKYFLYLSVGEDVMLTSIFWTEVGLNNGYKVTVVDFVYTDSEGPRNGDVPEAVLEQFLYLTEITDIEPFIEGCERSVAIPMKNV